MSKRTWFKRPTPNQLQALAERAQIYQPWWATQAHWLKRTGKTDLARAAYTQAIALSSDPSVRQFLETQAQAL